MTLRDAIERAANLAFDENADQIVGQIDAPFWTIAHCEDEGRIAQMKEPKFTVHSTGVDVGHIERGEITADWTLPE